MTWPVPARAHLVDQLRLRQCSQLEAVVIPEQPGFHQADRSAAEQGARRRRQRRSSLSGAHSHGAQFASMVRGPKHAGPLNPPIGVHGQFEDDDCLERMRRTALENAVPVGRQDVLRESPPPVRLGSRRGRRRECGRRRGGRRGGRGRARARQRGSGTAEGGNNEGGSGAAPKPREKWVTHTDRRGEGHLTVQSIAGVGAGGNFIPAASVRSRADPLAPRAAEGKAPLPGQRGPTQRTTSTGQ